MSCVVFRAQMVDSLYGELEGKTRAAFEAHVAGCASCLQEIEGLHDTLGTARRVIAEAMAEAPPARVRETVLAAVAEAAVRRRSPEGRFLAWLRRAWAFPTFAAASLAAVFVTRQLITRPDAAMKLLEADRVETGQAASPASAPANAAPANESMPATMELPKDAGPAAGPRSESPRTRARAKTKESSSDDAAESSTTAAPPTTRFASPPASVASPPAIPADPADAEPFPSYAPPASGESESAMGMPAHFSKPARASKKAGAARSEDSGEDAPLPLDALVRKTEEAFEHERWAEAHTGYRELLQRFPDDARVRTWRARLQVVNAAIERR